MNDNKPKFKKSANWPSKNLLSLSPFPLTKHPSAKNLETLSEQNTRSESFSSSCCKKENKICNKFIIDIDPAEDVSYSKDDNYYIKNEDIIMQNNINNTNTVNSNFYNFTGEQMKIDEIITKNIQNGLTFEEIEKSFKL